MGIQSDILPDVIDNLHRCRSKGSVVQIGLMSFQVNVDEILSELEKYEYCKYGDGRLGFRYNVPRLAELIRSDNYIVSQRTSRGRFVDPKLVFLAMGFDAIHALDISDHDGADLLGDLNESDLHRQIGRQFGTIVEIGTIEHVFHVPNALWNLVRMCELGGEIIHAAPTNNWPNHGFYQLSPTLFHDYYTANGFEVIGSYFTRYAAVPSDPVNRLRYRHDASFRDPIPLDGCRYLFWFHARKIAESDRPVFPQQAAYAALAQWDPLKSSKDGKGPMAP